MLSSEHQTDLLVVNDDPKPEYDVVFVGGGHNALICSAYLAQKGLRVAVFEARGGLGGMAVCAGDEDDAAAHLTDFAHLLKGLPSVIVKDLKLKKYGLAFSKHNIQTIAIDEDGNSLRLSKDLSKTLSAIRAISREDADAYERLQFNLGRLTKLIEPVLEMTPPSLKLNSVGIGDEIHAFLTKFKSREEGRIENLRAWLMSSLGDVLDQQFDSDLLKGALAWDGILGGSIDPRNINSSLVFLYRLASERLSGGMGRAYPKGGMHAFVNVLSTAAADYGVEFFVGRKVKKIILEQSKATGIELGDGEVVSSTIVVSGADPKLTFLDLVGAEELETEFVTRLKNIRSKGSLAKIDLHLRELPTFRGLNEEDLSSRIVIAPSLGHLERAAAALKYNTWSDAPGFEITFPTLLDRTAVGDGHVMSCLMHYVPFDVEGGWENNREAFEDDVIRALSFYAPDLPQKMDGLRILLPTDIAEEWNNSGGHWHHLELALDQCASFRPTFGAAQYTLPIEDLYLCGAGAHPGGGLMGLPGYNAARQIIHDLENKGMMGREKR